MYIIPYFCHLFEPLLLTWPFHISVCGINSLTILWNLQACCSNFIIIIHQCNSKHFIYLQFLWIILHLSMPSILQDRPHMSPGVWINTSCWFIQDDNLQSHQFPLHKICFMKQQGRQCTCRITMRHVHVTIVAEDKQ